MPFMVKSEQPPIKIRHATALGIIPLGETLAQWTKFEPADNKTQENLQSLQEHLHKQPALILDRHANPVDPIHTGLFLTHNLKFENAITPVAASEYFFPLYRVFLSTIINLPGAHIYPVKRDYREADTSSLSDKISLLSHHLFNKEEPFDQSFSFIKTAIKALKESWKNTMVFSATFTKNDPKEPVHKGISFLLKMGYPAFCVASYLDQSDSRYQTFVSGPLPLFNKQSPNSDIHNIVSQAHLDLKKHAFQETPTLTTQSIPIKKYLSSLFKNSL